MFNIIPNQWESEFFSQKIGNVNFDASAMAHNEKYDLLQAKVKSDEQEKIQQLQQQGFIFVAGEAKFWLNLKPQYVEIKVLDLSNWLVKRQWDIRIATKQDIPALQQLFGTAFSHSRFCEPYFSTMQQQQFYQYWISQAVLAKFDDICFCEMEGEIIRGAISLRKVEQNVQVGLLAVAPEFHRQGCAERLLNKAKIWSEQVCADKLIINTQLSNQAAIAFYQAQNAKLKQISYWFYKRP